MHGIIFYEACIRKENCIAGVFVRKFASPDTVLQGDCIVHLRVIQQSFHFLSFGYSPAGRTRIVGTFPLRTERITVFPSLRKVSPSFRGKSGRKSHSPIPLIKHTKGFRSRGESAGSVHIALCPAHSVYFNSRAALGARLNGQVQINNAVATRNGTDALKAVNARFCSDAESRVCTLIG